MDIKVRPIRSPEGDRLDVLMTLVEAYEALHWNIGLPDPIEAIRVPMEDKNLRQVDLVPMIGPRGGDSEVLSRKRDLTLPMIRRLAKGLDLGADALIQESQRTPSATNRRPSLKPSRGAPIGPVAQG